MRWRRLALAISGSDGPGRRALPLGEFLHPIPLLAAAVLGVNDHVLKGSGLLPGWLTGKLSDLAGLLFFPLLATAAADTLLYGIARATGAAIDFSLRRWKLFVAVAVTAAAFAALELSPAWQAFYVRTLGRLGFPSATTPDPTDLLALVMLAPAWALGVRHIRRLPLGRLEVIERARPHDVRRRLADVHALSRAPHDVEQLMAAFRAWLDDPNEETRARAAAAVHAVRYGP